MAFTLQTWARSSAGANEGVSGSLRRHVYVTADTQAAAAAASDYDGLGTEVRSGDQVAITSTSDVTTVNYTIARNLTTGVIGLTVVA